MECHTLIDRNLFDALDDIPSRRDLAEEVGY